MIISHSHKFVYTHLEKCGGTSVEKSISTVLAPGDTILGSTIEGELNQAYLFESLGIGRTKKDYLWKHSTTPQIYRFLKNDWKSYKKLSVVREPVSLAKSLFAYSQKVTAYHLKIDTSEWAGFVRRGVWPSHFPYTEGYVRSYITSVVNKSRFDGFVQDMIHNQYLCFSPYYWRLRPSVFDSGMGLVIDLAELDIRWSEVQEYLGIELPPVEHANQSASADLNIKQISIDRIKNHFKIDYYQEYGVNWNG